MTQQSDSAGFNVIATKAFRFLVDIYGYSLRIRASEAVEFAKDDLVFEVFREPVSFMIYAQIALRSTGEIYVLHEILKALAPEEILTAHCYGKDSTTMRNCLARLGQLCQRYLQSILSGDTAAMDKVAASANDSRRRYTLECQFGAIRDRANRAWELQEWDSARKLYEDSRPILSYFEKRRLEFLIKRIEKRDG